MASESGTKANCFYKGHPSTLFVLEDKLEWARRDVPGQPPVSVPLDDVYGAKVLFSCTPAQMWREGTRCFSSHFEIAGAAARIVCSCLRKKQPVVHYLLALPCILQA